MVIHITLNFPIPTCRHCSVIQTYRVDSQTHRVGGRESERPRDDGPMKRHGMTRGLVRSPATLRNRPAVADRHRTPADGVLRPAFVLPDAILPAGFRPMGNKTRATDRAQYAPGRGMYETSVKPVRRSEIIDGRVFGASRIRDTCYLARHYGRNQYLLSSYLI